MKKNQIRRKSHEGLKLKRKVLEKQEEIYQKKMMEEIKKAFDRIERDSTKNNEIQAHFLLQSLQRIEEKRRSVEQFRGNLSSMVQVSDEAFKEVAQEMR